MQVYAKVVYAGLCHFCFYCKLKLKKENNASLFKSGLCDFGFHCKMKLKKSGLCWFMQK